MLLVYHTLDRTSCTCVPRRHPASNRSQSHTCTDGDITVTLSPILAHHLDRPAANLRSHAKLLDGHIIYIDPMPVVMSMHYALAVRRPGALHMQENEP